MAPCLRENSKAHFFEIYVFTCKGKGKWLFLYHHSRRFIILDHFPPDSFFNHHYISILN